MGKIRGPKRVLTFFLLTAVLPVTLFFLPLYLRHVTFADVTYSVAESDVLSIVDGMSSVFCESHTLHMNTTFNAFQLVGEPQLSPKRKHIRLKKSMSLPDDTLEYWGFFLLSGARVQLKVCSRYEGSRILVVRGERNLKTCGLMEHNYEKYGARMADDHDRVKVTFEEVAEVIGVVDTAPAPARKLKVAAAAGSSDGAAAAAGGAGNKAVQGRNAAVEDDENNGDDVKAIVNKRISKGKERLQKKRNETSSISNTIISQNSSSDNATSNHHKRHIRRKFLEKQLELYKLQQMLESGEEINLTVDHPQRRPARDVMSKLDGHTTHGGNAHHSNATTTTTTTNEGAAGLGQSGESSVSSFETSLLVCYDGQILLTQEFSPSHQCTDVHYLERANHMVATHEITSDGYYYYIFYSDNDYVRNDIHAVFDIYKPTYMFANFTKGNDCINQTECKFPVSFWSDETVIVEVPTRDGIEHEDEDFTTLISTCHPRMSVYVVFPIGALFMIMGCAFL